MKRVSIWLALSASANLLIASAAAVHAAAGDTVQTTGGGWIVPMVVGVPTSTLAPGELVPTAGNNPKATFGFVASATVQADGTTLGDFQGELSYDDHGAGLKLHSLSVTQVTVVDPTHTSFAGTAAVTTPAGAVTSPFVVTVYDGGEPGVGVDTFAIQLPGVFLPVDGGAFYQRQGTLGGGNIQVH